MLEEGMPAVRLPGLREKLGLLYAYTGLNQTLLAERLGRAGATVSGWVNGTDTTEPESVPDEGRESLAAILVEHLQGAIDLNTARRLWLGPVDEFARAFAETPAARFCDLLKERPRKQMLTYLPGGANAPLPVAFANDVDEADGRVIVAAIGDRFAFRMEGGAANAHIVLLVETILGVHLAVPGPRSPCRLDPQGHALLPRFPETYWFEEPRGRHRFLAFAIEALEPLSIAQAAGRLAPLPDNDLDRFAAEVCDRARVQSWLMDVALVDVR
jgi:hypothetical protein